MGTRHRSVIAFDPGNVTGWARFVDGVLWDAGTLKKGSRHFAPVLWGLGSIIAIIEKPVIYPLGKGKGDPNDLIGLALWAGELAGMMSQRAPGVDTAYVAPRKWKGTVPKPITNKRTLAALTDDERAKLPRRPRAKDFDHNMLDAIGIGLWQLEKERQR